MQIRIANENDVEALRRLYRELEADGVKYQPEHFVIGYRSDAFFSRDFREWESGYSCGRRRGNSAWVFSCHDSETERSGVFKAADSCIHTGPGCHGE